MIQQAVARLALLLAFATVCHGQDDDSWASQEATNFAPKIHHSNIADVTLFASHPQIVTPIGVAVAPDGRVFVQENHTHKRTSDYDGPEKDRILVFEDTDNDGVADKRSVFYEGDTFSTDLLFGPDGHLYVSTRWFIGRFLNAATKEVADGEPERLIVCETEGAYPHNGVGGLAIDPAHPEWLAFGFGENLGVDYTFVGADGDEISGGAEGGSTYRCRTDGTMLTRQSTGHWNAFGMAFDLAGNLFSTDNDPNATPPNRLLHIIPGADYGYEYRYGRSGRHPLVCWYGENPGTLGMIGALGEAACGVIAHGPDQLLSASWTDNRVDLHALKPKGTSFTATREPFLSGPDDFRPVHFSYSADGKYLYITDWVKLSYPVHGHGRIWRVEFKQPIQQSPTPRQSATLELSATDALDQLKSDDPYARTAAIHTLQQHPDVLESHDWKAIKSPTGRAHYAVARRRNDPHDYGNLIPHLLADKAQQVRFVGIKWIADVKIDMYRPALEKVLERADLTRRDLHATVAALARISGDSKKEFSPSDTLLDLAIDAARPPFLRTVALQGIDASNKRLTVAVLADLVKDANPNVRREAVRLLAVNASPKSAPILAQIAADRKLPSKVRADAIAGLASSASGHEKLLAELAASVDTNIADEAKRTLASARLLPRELASRPPVNDVDEWMALVDQAEGEPSIDVGRRLFFHSKLGGCYKCHAMNGRGQQIGPDLTTISNQAGITRRWLLEHIVNPNAEMAPYYRPQQLLTIEGRLLVGLIVGREGKKQAYVDTNGEIVLVDKDDVEARYELATSIMPQGLLDQMTASEIRDLIAYLMQGDNS